MDINLFPNAPILYEFLNKYKLYRAFVVNMENLSHSTGYRVGSESITDRINIISKAFKFSHANEVSGFWNELNKKYTLFLKKKAPQLYSSEPRDEMPYRDRLSNTIWHALRERDDVVREGGDILDSGIDPYIPPSGSVSSSPAQTITVDASTGNYYVSYEHPNPFDGTIDTGGTDASTGDG